MKRKNETYTDDFKQHIVTLYNTGKPSKEILAEYELASSTLCKWKTYYNRTQSFREKDNRSAHENELIKLRKENQQLKMEIDILQQAALILARKSK